MEFIHTEENGIKYLIHPSGSIFAGIKMRENHEDAFDNAIKLCQFYNCKALFEASRVSIK